MFGTVSLEIAVENLGLTIFVDPAPSYPSRAPSVTNSVSDGPPDLHNIPYQTGQRTMGPCCVYPR
jgi:hypothetical protein